MCDYGLSMGLMHVRRIFASGKLRRYQFVLCLVLDCDAIDVYSGASSVISVCLWLIG
jgi:hypothetical protein